MMIKPGIEELSQDGKYNRYILCVATAKCARIVTDEYVEQFNRAQNMVANKETDKTINQLIPKQLRDDKAVKEAIRRISADEYQIDDSTIVAPGDNVR